MCRFSNRQVMIFATLVFQAGCGAGPLEPRDIPEGVYVLETIGGRPLPVTLDDRGGQEVLADTLFIDQETSESPGSRRVVRRSAIRVPGGARLDLGARYWLALRDGALELGSACSDPAANCAVLITRVELATMRLVLHGAMLGLGANRAVYRVAR